MSESVLILLIIAAVPVSLGAMRLLRPVVEKAVEQLGSPASRDEEPISPSGLRRLEDRLERIEDRLERIDDRLDFTGRLLGEGDAARRDPGRSPPDDG